MKDRNSSRCCKLILIRSGNSLQKTTAYFRREGVVNDERVRRPANLKHSGAFGEKARKQISENLFFGIPSSIEHHRSHLPFIDNEESENNHHLFIDDQSY